MWCIHREGLISFRSAIDHPMAAWWSLRTLITWSSCSKVRSAAMIIGKILFEPKNTYFEESHNGLSSNGGGDSMEVNEGSEFDSRFICWNSPVSSLKFCSQPLNSPKSSIWFTPQLSSTKLSSHQLWNSHHCLSCIEKLERCWEKSFDLQLRCLWFLLHNLCWP